MSKNQKAKKIFNNETQLLSNLPEFTERRMKKFEKQLYDVLDQIINNNIDKIFIDNKRVRYKTFNNYELDESHMLLLDLFENSKMINHFPIFDSNKKQDIKIEKQTRNFNNLQFYLNYLDYIININTNNSNNTYQFKKRNTIITHKNRKKIQQFQKYCHKYFLIVKIILSLLETFDKINPIELRQNGGFGRLGKYISKKVKNTKLKAKTYAVHKTFMMEMKKFDNKLNKFLIKLIKEYINFIIRNTRNTNENTKIKIEIFKQDMFRNFWKVLYKSMIFSSLNIPIYKPNNPYQTQNSNQLQNTTQTVNQSHLLANKNINKMSRKRMKQRLNNNTRKSINKSVDNSLDQQNELNNILFTLKHIYYGKKYETEKNISNIFENNNYLNKNTMKTMKKYRNNALKNTKKNTFKYNMKYDLYADYCFKYYIRINLILAVFKFFDEQKYKSLNFNITKLKNTSPRKKTTSRKKATTKSKQEQKQKQKASNVEFNRRLTRLHEQEGEEKSNTASNGLSNMLEEIEKMEPEIQQVSNPTESPQTEELNQQSESKTNSNVGKSKEFNIPTFVK
jgi:hypothetical protein